MCTSKETNWLEISCSKAYFTNAVRNASNRDKASGLEIAQALKAELPGWTIMYCDEFRWQFQKELGLTPDACHYEV